MLEVYHFKALSNTGSKKVSVSSVHLSKQHNTSLAKLHTDILQTRHTINYCQKKINQPIYQ